VREPPLVIAGAQEIDESSTSATRCGASCLIFSINTCLAAVIASTPWVASYTAEETLSGLSISASTCVVQARTRV
jgi:hypothetical protein